MKRKTSAACFLIILFLGSSLSADQVFLKNGEILHGKVLSINKHTIDFLPEGDRPFRILDARDVNNVNYDDGRIIAVTPPPQEEFFGQTDSDQKAVETKPEKITQKKEELSLPRIKSPYAHDGINIRFMSGFGYGQTSVNSIKKYTFNGYGIPASIAIGYGFEDNWVLHLVGGYCYLSAERPKTNSSTLNSGQKNQMITMYEYGFGLSYYFLPSDFFITLSGTSQRITFKGDFVRGSASSPVSASLYVGKEWKVSDNFSVGAAVMGTYTSISVSNTNSLGSSVGNFFTGILLSTSYRL